MGLIIILLLGFVVASGTLVVCGLIGAIVGHRHGAVMGSLAALTGAGVLFIGGTALLAVPTIATVRHTSVSVHTGSPDHCERDDDDDDDDDDDHEHRRYDEQSVRTISYDRRVTPPQPATATEIKTPPAWLNQSAARSHDQYTVAVRSKLFASEAEARTTLNHVIDSAAQTMLHPEERSSPLPPALALPPHVRSRAIADTYTVVEQINRLDGQPMYDVHALLIFDEKGRREVERVYTRHALRDRLWIAGGSVAGIVGMLTLGWLVMRRVPQKKHPAYT